MYNFIANALIVWYEENKRDLPWRNTHDPYFIWISEIILQQTRVNQGLPYFHNFVEQFPDVKALATAPEEKVLRAWQGLGYYSRARNLHAAAKFIYYNLEGNFPKSFSSLLNLKGVGEYTAAAIASFAYKEKVPVLDGNVMRVLSRLFDLQDDIKLPATRKKMLTLAGEIIPGDKPDLFNQAIMEFGALHCTPVNPACSACVLNVECEAFKNKTQNQRPVKSQKVTVKERYFNYIVFKQENGVYMKQRKGGDIWQGLFDFYLYETDQLLEKQDNLIELLGYRLGNEPFIVGNESRLYKHILTHQKLWVKFWIVDIKNLPYHFINQNNLILLSPVKISEAPKPILIEKFLKSTFY